MKPQCYFVTGTDTGVGKTQVTAALLLSAQAHGLRGLGLKPVAAGCAHADGRLVNEDALLLQRCSSLRADYAVINPDGYVGFTGSEAGTRQYLSSLYVME